MITLALHNETATLNDILVKDKNAKWCYIGKDVLKRNRISDLFGEAKRYYLKGRLLKIAEKLRQPYLNFVANLGRRQANQLNWWAGRFASKSPFQIDFFLLLCYKALIIELAQEDDKKNNLVIFVENRWLFGDIKDTFKNEKGIRFFGREGVFFLKIFYITRGILYRFFLALWFIAARVLMHRCHRGREPLALETGNQAVVIVSPIEKRSFKDGEYSDNFMSSLADFYKKNKVRFFYLYYFPFELSTVRYVGENSAVLWPLIIDINFFGALKRIFACWRPVRGDILKKIDNYDVTLLLNRERYIEFSSAGFNLRLILFDAFNRFFSRGWCSAIIYLFENQPWEKMLCMSAARKGIRAVGYQHSAIWSLFVSQFAGEGEDAIMPLPYRIVTTGSHFARMYRQGGIPEDKIVVGGAWRYPHLWEYSKSGNYAEKRQNFKPTILVSLPIDISISNVMLKDILKMTSRNELIKYFDLWIKPHPAVSLKSLKMADEISSYGCRVVNKPFSELLKDVDAVIFSASASGLEAYLYGKKVVAYVPENLLAFNTLLDMEDKNIYEWHEGEELDVNFLRDFSSTANPEELKEKRKEYFSKIDDNLWLNLAMVGSQRYESNVYKF